MFEQCEKLVSINLTSFNTSKVKSMNDMFYQDKSLTEIKISSLWDVSDVILSDNMFGESTLLPNYNSSIVDVSMAKPTTQGGYLTLV